VVIATACQAGGPGFDPRPDIQLVRKNGFLVTVCPGARHKHCNCIVFLDIKKCSYKSQGVPAS
jgi:hypothetical protein